MGLDFYIFKYFFRILFGVKNGKNPSGCDAACQSGQKLPGLIKILGPPTFLKDMNRKTNSGIIKYTKKYLDKFVNECKDLYLSEIRNLEMDKFVKVFFVSLRNFF